MRHEASDVLVATDGMMQFALVTVVVLVLAVVATWAWERRRVILIRAALMLASVAVRLAHVASRRPAPASSPRVAAWPR